MVVHGMVNTAKRFTMADLKRFPSVTRKHFIECSGNGLTEWNKPTLKTVQGTHGMLSTSEWTGVQFSTIAREVGLKDGSAWVVAEGADAAVMTRSVPMEKMLRDALDAFVRRDMALAEAVLAADDTLDALKTQIFRELLTYMLQSPETIEPALDLILISRHLERIGDHATNVAEDVIFILSARDVRHHGTDTTRGGDN